MSFINTIIKAVETRVKFEKAIEDIKQEHGAEIAATVDIGAKLHLFSRTLDEPLQKESFTNIVCDVMVLLCPEGKASLARSLITKVVLDVFPPKGCGECDDCKSNEQVFKDATDLLKRMATSSYPHTKPN